MPSEMVGGFPIRAALMLAMISMVCAHAAYVLALYGDSLGTITVLAAVATTGLFVWVLARWRSETTGATRHLPLAAFLAAPIVGIGVLAFEEAIDNDALEAVTELARTSCAVPTEDEARVAVDVVEHEGSFIAIFEPPRSLPDDVSTPAFTDRAIDPASGELSPTQVLCVSYPASLGSGAQWCRPRSYVLRTLSGNRLDTAVALPLSQDFKSENQQRYCDFEVSEASSPLIADIVVAAAAADQPLETVIETWR